MKILAFSDLHHDELALESLTQLAKKHDFVFICGDISRTEIFADSVLHAFPNSFIIPGNWDSEHVNTIFSSTPNWVHEKRAEIGSGLNVVGFGFSPPTPFGTFGEISEQEIFSRMSKLKIDGNTLLLLHTPPKGYFDEALFRHIGSASILKIIEEKKPLAAFFGHAHEQIGTAMLGPTRLIKLPPANSMRACSLTIKNKKITSEFINL
ncbi:3',5'-cyclic adenosine monophosphate phosphodiesterase CpdA [Candidatus Bilamarchaeum dharawalense]|uniref:3',5'-cyclic adenosine monophosphate phosphodiesterase CpdA n=1 Tax=Candidatus Bilamarchaeum dharawalense TaxID=2885759 RepID=A0A5E4LVI3_9ARCH|nr:3',5'-cyclic adenosine monophosphate phosphodiesterase CpdA [Candidatus Bilamarchaeum dharawalense]